MESLLLVLHIILLAGNMYCPVVKIPVQNSNKGTEKHQLEEAQVSFMLLRTGICSWDPLQANAADKICSKSARKT